MFRCWLLLAFHFFLSFYYFHAPAAMITLDTIIALIRDITMSAIVSRANRYYYVGCRHCLMLRHAAAIIFATISPLFSPASYMLRQLSPQMPR